MSRNDTGGYKMPGQQGPDYGDRHYNPDGHGNYDNTRNFDQQRNENLPIPGGSIGDWDRAKEGQEGEYTRTWKDEMAMKTKDLYNLENSFE